MSRVLTHPDISPGDPTAWLTTQSEANRSHPVTPCFPLLCSAKQGIFPSFRTTSGQHFFKFCRLFRWLWSFPFDARTAISPPQNRDIFLCFRDARLDNRGKSQTTAKATTTVFA